MRPNLPCAAFALGILLGLGQPVLAGELRCSGRSPDWSLAVAPGAFTFREAKGKEAAYAAASARLEAEGITVWRGRPKSGSGDVVAMVIENLCMEPEPGSGAQHAAVLSLPGGRILSGCCVAPASDGDAASMSAAIGMTVMVGGAEGGRINVRDAAGRTTGRVVAKLDAGKPVTVAATSEAEGDVWYRITGAGLPEQAWVLGELVEPDLGPEPPPEPVAEPPPEVVSAAVTSAAGTVAATADDWSQALPDLLPAVALCIEATAAKPAIVTKAWPMNQGLAGVRVRDATGARMECIAAPGSTRPDSYIAVADGMPPLPGEGHPIFTPAPQTPPSGECWRNEPVVLPDSEAPVGTLSYLTC